MGNKQPNSKRDSSAVVQNRGRLTINCEKFESKDAAN